MPLDSGLLRSVMESINIIKINRLLLTLLKFLEVDMVKDRSIKTEFCKFCKDVTACRNYPLPNQTGTITSNTTCIQHHTIINVTCRRTNLAMLSPAKNAANS